jgi:hypothetical protein
MKRQQATSPDNTAGLPFENLDTLILRMKGAVLFVEIAAPPMNLLGPELVRDLVTLIQRVESDVSC